MAKDKKNATNGQTDAPLIQLALLDFDAVVDIKATVPEAPARPEAPDTEEQALATVENFDTVFADDPLKDKIKAWALKIKSGTDGLDKAIAFVGYGAEACELMVEKKNIAPGSYDRSKVIKTFDNALALCNVATTVKPQEMIQVYWFVQLVRSTPGAEGEARTYPGGPPPADWFGGNLLESVLRVMAKTITRVSKDGELDCWEFKPGYEPSVRDWVDRLRRGVLSLRQVETAIEHRGKVLAHERKQIRMAGLNAAERESIEASERNQEREAKLASLGRKALALQQQAATECQKNATELRDFLASKGVIPPVKFPTIAEIAARFTPGDAKALLQELVKQGAVHRDRIEVFTVFYQISKQFVAQLKSAREQELAKRVG
jgi:hypothetical protein